jgi:ferrochelatase
MTDAVLLVSHGTVDDLADLAAFVTNVRRGHAPPPELVAELRRRYDAIGGRSPLNAINAELAGKLARRLGLRVALANRLWRPFVRDVVAGLAGEGVRRVAVVPLAQHSGHVYADDARRAVEGVDIELRCAPSWGRAPALCAAFADRIAAAAAGQPDPERTTVVMTAHSLPRSVVDAGDPYERDVRGAVEDIEALVRQRLGRAARVLVCFQSQGMSTGPAGRPVEWLGPDPRAAVALAAGRGDRHLVFAPVGFLADHVEILYDLDVEARAMAIERGLSFTRVPSLNADDDLVEVLAGVAGELLSHD